MANEYGTVCFDFDGVIHSYQQPWNGHSVIPDPPSPGAIDCLRSILKSEFEVAIFSVRSELDEGRRAIRDWLIKYGLSDSEAQKVKLPTHKPKALLYVDDRAYLFTGENWPTLDFIRNFHPWNRDENHQYLPPDQRTTQVLPQKAKTAPMRFGKDWRGLFIRGKDCRKFELAIRAAMMDPERIKNDGEIREDLNMLIALLQKSDEQEACDDQVQHMVDFQKARSTTESVAS